MFQQDQYKEHLFYSDYNKGYRLLYNTHAKSLFLEEKEGDSFEIDILFKYSKEIIFHELSLREKISQMIMVGGRIFDKRFLNLSIGGIFLPRFNSKEAYKSVISKYQNKRRWKQRMEEKRD